MDQPPLIGVPPAPTPEPRTILTDLELGEIRRKLIEGDGKIECLGPEGLKIMRDVIYTCRMKANPMQEDPESPKAPRRKRSDSESTNRQKSTGLDVNNLLG